MPTVAASDAGGPYDGFAFSATATVAGAAGGIDTTPAAALAGVSPTLTYYPGSTASGNGSSTAPSTMGTYTVVAFYSGSTDYQAAYSPPATFTIGPAVITETDVSLAVSTSIAALGQAVTATATVVTDPLRPVQPNSGTVTFFDGGTVLATIPLHAGSASYTASLLALGPHFLTAQYSGDGVSFLGSNSARVIAAVAGTGSYGFSGDGGPAAAAALDVGSGGLALDAAGDLFTADFWNDRVREINHATGIITTVAGSNAAGHSGDGGQATAAKLNLPEGLAIDNAGHLFIGELGYNFVREVNLATGIITTVAGNGTYGSGGDGGPATAAGLNAPEGLAVDNAGDLFIADSDNERIRKVDLTTGIITTVAGNGILGYSGDGGPATAAEFYGPDDVKLDGAGHLFIADPATSGFGRSISPRESSRPLPATVPRVSAATAARPPPPNFVAPAALPWTPPATSSFPIKATIESAK